MSAGKAAPAEQRRRPAWWVRTGDFGRARILLAFGLAVVLPLGIEVVLQLTLRRHFATEVLIYLAGTVAVALVGGLWPALLAAMLGGLMLSYFATDPVGSLIIDTPENVLTVLFFVAVAAAVSFVVDLAARRRREAVLARAEAGTLAALARSVLTAEDAIHDFLEQVSSYFRADGAALFLREDHGWRMAESVGRRPPSSPREADTFEGIDDQLALALSGHPLSMRDRRLLTAFGSNLLAMYQRRELIAAQRDNLRLTEGNRMRTAILRAVSHDLRTPLAGIKLAVSSLRQEDVQFTRAEEQELLATIEDYSDRLHALVANLLDMSRITGDSVNPLLEPVAWRDVVDRALHGLPAGRVRVELPPNMPPVEADEGMLERVIANIVENAVKYAGESDVVISGSVGGAGAATVGGRPASELRIADAGRGVPAGEVLAMFQPFQRLGDTSGAAGIGLGLAVAKGFTEAMGGVLMAEPTPGGGLTMLIRLPLSAAERTGRR